MISPIENALALSLYSYRKHWSRERADKFAGMLMDVLRAHRVVRQFVAVWIVAGDVCAVLSQYPCPACDGYYWKHADEQECTSRVWCTSCHQTGLDIRTMVVALGGSLDRKALSELLWEGTLGDD